MDNFYAICRFASSLSFGPGDSGWRSGAARSDSRRAWLVADAGDELILQDNVFVERLLPAGVLRPLSVEELAAYRRPFAEPGEGRRPTLTWPREIPIDGEPADVAQIVAAYADWLATSDVPKLFVKAEPGAILSSGANLDFVRRWPAQAEVTVAGSHFVQEDAPDEIGRAIADWMVVLG